MADTLLTYLPYPVISRSEAKASGLQHYYTGRPCILGHLDKRYTASGRCAECEREKARKWYHENRDANLERTSRWKRDNPEKLARYNDLYKATKIEKQKSRRSANPGYDNAKYREYHEKHPERYRVYRLSNLCKSRGVEGTSTPDDIKRIYADQKGKCAICREKVDQGYHVDHIVPISKGGTNWPSNLQITCPPCNRSKSQKDSIEHMRSLGFLL